MIPRLPRAAPVARAVRRRVRAEAPAARPAEAWVESLWVVLVKPVWPGAPGAVALPGQATPDRLAWAWRATPGRRVSGWPVRRAPPD